MCFFNFIVFSTLIKLKKLNRYFITRYYVYEFDVSYHYTMKKTFKIDIMIFFYIFFKKKKEFRKEEQTCNVGNKKLQ